jgi:hypothetical protein
MKRGRKPTPDKLKLIRGTLQPVRRRGSVVPPLEGEVGPPPAWLKGTGRKLWDQKVAIYAARGQAVKGCESALAQYVALEIELIRRYRKGLDVTASLLGAYRSFCGEFFDTPASQVGRVAAKAPDNRFAVHAGKR